MCRRYVGRLHLRARVVDDRFDVHDGRQRSRRDRIVSLAVPVNGLLIENEQLEVIARHVLFDLIQDGFVGETVRGRAVDFDDAIAVAQAAYGSWRVFGHVRDEHSTEKKAE